MSFCWEAYVRLAENLIKNQTTGLEDACLRSAISRSYYGVFGVARSYLMRNGITISPIDTHKYLRNEFKNSPDKTKKKIGQNMERLWRDRKDADYEDAIYINLNRAQISYQMAIRILQDLKNLGTP